MLDSKPLVVASDATILRTISRIGKGSIYHKNTSIPNTLSKYNNQDAVCVRVFLKALFSNSLNTDASVFKSYSDILEFIKGFDDGIKLNTNVISIIKHRYAKSEFTKFQVYKNEYSLNFVAYLKIKFPDFNESDFFN